MIKVWNQNLGGHRSEQKTYYKFTYIRMSNMVFSSKTLHHKEKTGKQNKEKQLIVIFTDEENKQKT